jgi:hypothetical protein
MADDQRYAAGSALQLPRVEDDAPSIGDPELIARIDEHVTRHIGVVEDVFHEFSSPYVHLDVHHVAPTAARPYHVLVTSGMSEMPMNTPAAAERFRYAELMVCLPSWWCVSDGAFRDERWAWPVRWLKMLARMPHEYATWLAYGHTIPNGDPPAPLASNTDLSAILLVPPVSLPVVAHQLQLDSTRTVHFWTLVPLHTDELSLKLSDGMEALLPLLDAGGITEIVDPGRKSVVR